MNLIRNPLPRIALRYREPAAMRVPLQGNNVVQTQGFHVVCTTQTNAMRPMAVASVILALAIDTYGPIVYNRLTRR